MTRFFGVLVFFDKWDAKRQNRHMWCGFSRGRGTSGTSGTHFLVTFFLYTPLPLPLPSPLMYTRLFLKVRGYILISLYIIASHSSHSSHLAKKAACSLNLCVGSHNFQNFQMRPTSHTKQTKKKRPLYALLHSCKK